jgi:predicted site-specific integrase-resolvase
LSKLFNVIVNSSIKKDKLYQIIHNYQQQNDLKNQLLVIKNLADNYPVSQIILLKIDAKTGWILGFFSAISTKILTNIR